MILSQNILYCTHLFLIYNEKGVLLNFVDWKLLPMIMKKITARMLDTNNYLIIDEVLKSACLIDCTKVGSEIELALKESGATLKYVLLTHGHFNHLLGISDLRQKYNVQVFMHEADKKVLKDIKREMVSLGLKPINLPKIDVFMKEFQQIKVGKLEVEVLHTPGHTPGSVSYLIENNIFTGDTLLHEEVGSTQNRWGDEEMIKSSIKSKIISLKDSIIIQPGHGVETTIEHEKFYNPEI